LLGVKAAAAETVGAVTAAMGANTLTASPGSGTNSTYFSADLTLASLTRLPGATVNFVASNLD
jgi:hypothetical protein